jgi:hypothetical protein
MSIIPLSNNKRNIFKEGIENHEKTDPRGIPQKEKRGKKDKNPVRQLGSTGLRQEGLEVLWARIVQFFLLETEASKDPCSVWKMLFPSFDFQHLLIDIALSFPFPVPEQPMIRIEMLRRNSNHHGHDTDVNDEPGNEIDDDRPEGGEIDESHESKSFPFAVLTSLPFQRTFRTRKMRTIEYAKTITKKTRGIWKRRAVENPKFPIRKSIQWI